MSRIELFVIGRKDEFDCLDHGLFVARSDFLDIILYVEDEDWRDYRGEAHLFGDDAQASEQIAALKKALGIKIGRITVVERARKSTFARRSRELAARYDF